MTKKTGMVDELYEELHEKYFPNGGVADHLFSGDIESARRTDIDDSFVKMRAKISEIFPEIELTDPGRIDRATALCAFFERTGFEDGIGFYAAESKKRSQLDPNSAENVARNFIEAVAY